MEAIIEHLTSTPIQLGALAKPERLDRGHTPSNVQAFRMMYLTARRMRRVLPQPKCGLSRDVLAEALRREIREGSR